MAFVPVNVRKKPEVISHIFTGEDNVKTTSKRNYAFVPDRVMFNDAYVEKPKINENKKLRYLVENRARTYTDDPKGIKNSAMDRKIKDTYCSNPLKVYNNYEIKKMNDSEKMKNSSQCQAYNAIFKSDGVKRSLGGLGSRNTKPKEREIRYNNITNNNFNITSNSMILNKDSENKTIPYYGRRHYVVAPYGRGQAMTYL